MNIPFLAVLALTGSLQFVFGADITGKVVLKGTPNAELPIDMASSFDKTCGAAHSGLVTTRHYLVSQDGGLADVFVYIRGGVSQKHLTAPVEEPMIEQIGCLFGQ